MLHERLPLIWMFERQPKPSGHSSCPEDSVNLLKLSQVQLTMPFVDANHPELWYHVQSMLHEVLPLD